ncbi:MAG: hypothetical protein R3A47_12420 [Polyangiales bacterium]
MVLKTQRLDVGQIDTWNAWVTSNRSNERINLLFRLFAALDALYSFCQADFSATRRSKSSTTAITLPIVAELISDAANTCSMILALSSADSLSSSFNLNLDLTVDYSASPDACLSQLAHRLRAFQRLTSSESSQSSEIVAAALELILIVLSPIPYFQFAKPTEFRFGIDGLLDHNAEKIFETIPDTLPVASLQVLALELARLTRIVELSESVYSKEQRPSLALSMMIASIDRLDALRDFLLNGFSNTLAQNIRERIISVRADTLRNFSAQYEDTIFRIHRLRRALQSLAHRLETSLRSQWISLCRALRINELENERTRAITEDFAILASMLRNASSDVLHSMSERRNSGITERSRPSNPSHIRQQAWMLRQVLRAFISRSAVAKNDSDGWEIEGSAQLFDTFAEHFNVLGTTFLSMRDESAVLELQQAIAEVESRGFVDEKSVQRVRLAAMDAERELANLFDHLSKVELRTVPFQKEDAVEHLRRLLHVRRPDSRPHDSHWSSAMPDLTKAS